MTFADQSTDDSGVVAWAWDFGDGSQSTAQNPSYTYASAGTYTVTLTVTDDDAAINSISKTVTVTAASANTVSVYNITMTPKVAGKNVFVQAVVTVHDQDDGPIAGAVVSADWYVNGTEGGHERQQRHGQ